jgi:hypothetical protein
MNTLVISGFPASGKTTYSNRHDNREVIDYAETDNTPSRIAQDIRYLIGRVCIIFVDASPEMRSTLSTYGIDYSLVFPEADMKQEWLDRMKADGYSEVSIDAMRDNWDMLIQELESDRNALYKIRLSKDNPFIDGSTIDNIELCRHCGQPIERTDDQVWIHTRDSLDNSILAKRVCLRQTYAAP